MLANQVSWLLRTQLKKIILQGNYNNKRLRSGNYNNKKLKYFKLIKKLKTFNQIN